MIHKLQTAIEQFVATHPVIGGILVGLGIIVVAIFVYRSMDA